MGWYLAVTSQLHAIFSRMGRLYSAFDIDPEAVQSTSMGAAPERNRPSLSGLPSFGQSHVGPGMTLVCTGPTCIGQLWTERKPKHRRSTPPGLAFPVNNFAQKVNQLPSAPASHHPLGQLETWRVCRSMEQSAASAAAISVRHRDPSVLRFAAI